MKHIVDTAAGSGVEKHTDRWCTVSTSQRYL